jgi:hypothetical protein
MRAKASGRGSNKPGELDAAWAAMQRMSLLYSIRDGIKTLDEDLNGGLRYILDDNPMDRPSRMGIPADCLAST